MGSEEQEEATVTTTSRMEGTPMAVKIVTKADLLSPMTAPDGPMASTTLPKPKKDLSRKKVPAADEDTTTKIEAHLVIKWVFLNWTLCYTFFLPYNSGAS